MWNSAMELFRDYMGTGWIIGFFIVAVVYLFFTETDKAKRLLFIYIPVVLLLIYFNPLFCKLLYTVIGDEIYYRILWLIPVTMVLAYGITVFYQRIRGWRGKGFLLLAAMLVMISGLLLQGLPVPATGKAVVGDVDLLDLSQSSRRNQLAREGIEGGKEGLLKDRQRHALFRGESDQLVALVSRASKGLFDQHVEAVQQQVARDGVVHLGVGRVDDEVDVVQGIQLGVVGKGAAAGVELLCHASAVLVKVDHVGDVVVLVVLTAVVLAVDVLSTASLTDDGKVQLLHRIASFFPLAGRFFLSLAL